MGDAVGIALGLALGSAVGGEVDGTVVLIGLALGSVVGSSVGSGVDCLVGPEEDSWITAGVGADEASNDGKLMGSLVNLNVSERFSPKFPPTR